MIEFDVADLAEIAGHALGIGTDAALAQLDIAAARAALAEARQAGVLRDQAAAAAAGVGLVHALLRHRPFPGQGELVAVAAGLQFLAVNGWRADLDPPEDAVIVVEGLASGQLTPADAASWLSPRLSPHPAREVPMRALPPGLRYRARRIIRHPVATVSARRKPGIHTPATGYVPFTDHARDSVRLAWREARRLGYDHWDPRHLLLGLIGQDDSAAARALERLGISPEAVRQHLGQITAQDREQDQQLPHPHPAEGVIQGVLDEVVARDDDYAGTEHLLLALFCADDKTAAQTLARLGAGESQVRGAVTAVLAESGRKRSA